MATSPNSLVDGQADLECEEALKKKRKGHRHRYGKPVLTVQSIFIGPFEHKVNVEFQWCECGKVKP